MKKDNGQKQKFGL